MCSTGSRRSSIAWCPTSSATTRCNSACRNSTHCAKNRMTGRALVLDAASGASAPYTYPPANPRPGVASLPSANRGLHAPEGRSTVWCDLLDLPFASQSLDLVVLPHMLEFAQRAAPGAARSRTRADSRRPVDHLRLQFAQPVGRAPIAREGDRAAVRARRPATSSRSRVSRTGSSCSDSILNAAASAAIAAARR